MAIVDQLMAFVQMVLANWETILASLSAIVGGLIALALLIPGDQPEKALYGIADFLAKFSRKPSGE